MANIRIWCKSKTGYSFMYRLFEELPKADTEEALEKLLPWNMTGIPPYKLKMGKN